MLWKPALLLALAGAIWSCSDPVSETPPPPTPLSFGPLLTAVSPNEALALSAAITVRMSGSGFRQSVVHHSTALWRVGSDTTALSTTFVSDTVLTAVIPPSLLQGPVHASLLLQTGPQIDEGRMIYSNSLGFEVKPLGGISVTPAAAPVGSIDVTITVRGSGFRYSGHHDLSWVVLSINGQGQTLATKFLSNSSLKAIIPAALLMKPVVATLTVWTGDPMADAVISGTTDFTVTP